MIIMDRAICQYFFYFRKRWISYWDFIQNRPKLTGLMKWILCLIVMTPIYSMIFKISCKLLSFKTLIVNFSEQFAVWDNTFYILVLSKKGWFFNESLRYFWFSVHHIFIPSTVDNVLSTDCQNLFLTSDVVFYSRLCVQVHAGRSRQCGRRKWWHFKSRRKIEDRGPLIPTEKCKLGM